MLGRARVGSRSDLRFNIPPVPDGSGLEATAQVATLARQFDRQLDSWAQGAAQRAEVRERWRRALVETVGEDALERFRSYSREQRDSNYGLGPIAPDREGLGRLNEARRGAHQGSFELMRELGVDAGRVRAVHDEFGRDLMPSIAAGDSSQGAPEAAPNAAAVGAETIGDAVGDVHPVIDSGTDDGGATGDGWSKRVPGYDGWSWGYVLSWRGGNDPIIRPRAFPHDGLVGTSYIWVNRDAGDDDLMDLRSEASVGFWYFAPREGQIEVQARFGIAASPVVLITLSEEWGWSGAKARLGNDVFINVTPPEADPWRTNTWDFDISGSPDPWAHYGVGGPTYAIAQRTLGPVPGPGWVWVSAGTYSWTNIDLNDVSVYASIMAEWHVEEVLVRMV